MKIRDCVVEKNADDKYRAWQVVSSLWMFETLTSWFVDNPALSRFNLNVDTYKEVDSSSRTSMNKTIS